MDEINTKDGESMKEIKFTLHGDPKIGVTRFDGVINTNLVNDAVSIKLKALRWVSAEEPKARYEEALKRLTDLMNAQELHQYNERVR